MENILHLKAPGDWINDPNGFIYYKGNIICFISIFPALLCGEPCIGDMR